MNKSDIKPGLKTLRVKYHNCYVGTLALTNYGKVAFSYDKEWLETGFSISPFSLPLADKVFVPNNYIFDGLFGIFADSCKIIATVCFLLVCPSDISTGNYLTRIAGRLAHEIIFSGMNYDRFTDNFIKGKSAIKEGSPCISLIG